MHRQIINGRPALGKSLQEEEEDQARLKHKNLKQAQKRFAKERFQVDKVRRKKTADLIEQDTDPTQVMTKRQQYEAFMREYSKVDFEQVLQNEGVDFNNPDLNIKWLPLQFYDDCQLENIFIDDNINFNEIFMDENGQQMDATARALYKDSENNKYIWLRAKMLSYQAEEQKFKCQFDIGETRMIPRIYICFDIENPNKYAKRLMKAFQNRLYADSLVRYKFYIQAMPTDHLSKLSQHTIENLEILVKTKSWLNADLSFLMEEVANEYSYTLNSMIFDKYLYESAGDLIPHSLVLPPKAEELQVPQFGLLPVNKGPEIYVLSPTDILKVPSRQFTEIFKDFCLDSFYITPEAIKILQEVRNECNTIIDYEFFHLLKPNTPFKLEDFQNEMDKHCQQTVMKLKTQWQPNIEKIIRTNFANSDKGWGNLNLQDLSFYENSRLKRFIILVQTTMQDSLLKLCQKSFKNYLDYVCHFGPQSVEIKSSSSVLNKFKNNFVQDSTNEADIHNKQLVRPLFQIELLKNTDDNIFSYSKVPSTIVTTIQFIFDKLLDDLNKIPSIQKSILHEVLRKSKKQIFIESNLKAPKRNRLIDEMPAPVTPSLEWDENQWVDEIFANLTQDTQNSVAPLEIYLKTFDEHINILKIDPDSFVKTFDVDDSQGETVKEVDIEEIRDEIRKCYKLEKKIRENIPEQIQVSFFLIKSKETVNYLANKYLKTASLLIEIIGKRARRKTTQIFEEIQKIQRDIKETPANIEKLSEITEFMQIVPLKCVQMKKSIQDSMQVYQVLEEFHYKFTEEDIKKKWVVFGGPKEILEIIDTQKLILEKEKLKFKDKLGNEQEEFKQDLEEIEKGIHGFNQYTNLKDYQSVAEISEIYNTKLKKYNDLSRKFNLQESLFERDQTDYTKVQTLTKEFTPYSNLWITSRNWFAYKETWLNDKFLDLDADKCEKFMDDAVRLFNQITKFFRDRNITAVYKISDQVKKEIDDFKPKVPLMVALRKQGMKDRHWKQISALVGFEVYPDESTTFTKIIEMGLMNFVNQCSEIGDRAYKEFQIETDLRQMQTQWEQITLELKAYVRGSTNTFIVCGFEDINNILDEHLLKTQAMQFSPFKKPFEEEISLWNDQLKIMSDVLDEWCKYQVNWMYLQPIFDSPDISKQLPGEYKKFKSVDNNWKQTMNMSNQVKNCLKVCSAEGLLQKLKDGNENLEIIQKELNNYLERKRERFARFYFLSNDELLEILSRTKDPTAVQPYLKKVFENINMLQIDEAKKFWGMYSAEGEKVNFVHSIDPINKNVEDWMGEVEEMMRKSVRQALQVAITKYPCYNGKGLNKPSARVDWIKSHPGQVILNGTQVQWTTEVEEQLKLNAVQSYYEDILVQQLNDLVDAVRMPMTKQQKICLNALIVIDVHAKDVVETIYKSNICETTAFEWIAQLRYYWETNKSEEKNCWVRMVQTNFPYGYEYLGNTLRLVITPLTDRCYMTLMGALKLNMGGAPAGPAGTGKTESTKDLAKAMAKQCVVFNCSDQMDYIMVGKFFKGLASCGAWCCFDEFNRINIEVLSVIAQQLQILFAAKQNNQDKVENFEGSDIKILPTFCVFITMNPGYAGRTELPDNLKVLFRGVAMMVPDYAMIGEIMLYSFGFKKGRELAKKMVVTFTLSSEQLSSQEHYDYGMRAVRSVINAAGILKNAEPNVDEEVLLLRSLRDVNVPKFLKDDIPLFENIIKDLFPGIPTPQIDYGELLKAIENNCDKSSLCKVQIFITKIMQLYDTIQVRHGLMLVGPTGGGKTSNYNILKNALTDLNDKGYYKVKTWIMNPKAITMGQLYGAYNESTREWKDGVLANTVRDSARDVSGMKHWVVFDGPVDAIWIENMNTVLDDNKKLCLNSGEILTLSPYMTMMFEVEDLLVASPATVSRCGMVYMEPSSMGLQPLVTSWISQIPQNCKDKSKTFSNTLQSLFDIFLEPSIQFLRKNLKEVIPTMDNNITQSLCRIMNCYLSEYVDTELKKVTVEEIKQLEEMIDSIFLYAVIWSLCCTVDFAGREKFNVFIKNILNTHNTKTPFPYEKSIYDYYWDKKEQTWVLWSTYYDNFEIDVRLQYNEMMIPTVDSTRNTYNMQLLLNKLYHVVFPGPTGTGKSLNAANCLQYKMGDDCQYITLTFSAQTGANQTQATIDSKLDKRRRGIFGPPVGKKCVIFVDDLNMPKKEFFGAQPPIELLRQYLDHQGWFNTKDNTYMKFEDIVLLSAMGPPGGGRTSVTGRMLRHFNIIAYTELDEQTIKYIFTTLVNSFFTKFDQTVKDIIPEAINSVLVIYNRARNELLPTPKKSHYTFNLRDISKVFNGVCNASVKQCNDKVSIVRLWYHENMRIFSDRLIDDEDREFFKKILAEAFPGFQVSKEEILSEERILFGDFQQGRETTPRQYYQVKDLNALITQIYEFLEEFNQDTKFAGIGGKNAMKLVLFLDACEHICRIQRILRQPSGHALLLGVGGSGRQSLSKLSTFIAAYKLFQIEVIKGYNMRSWRDDIKKVLMMAGIEKQETTFLFVDTQIIKEQQVEDINNILNSGDVTGIYQDKDMDEIMQACKGECLKRNIQPNKMNIFSQYLLRVKQNIHLVIAMSPLSTMFQVRLRMFPSLVNCCTLDWFTEWPEEALYGVGIGQLSEFAESVGIDQELLPKLVNCFKYMHKSVEKISIQYKNELRRINFVTPTSYLELLTMFKQVMSEKRTALKNSIIRLKTGLDRLIQANIEVEKIQITLKDLQPKLEESAIQTEKVMIQIEIDKKSADETQKIVAVEEAIATTEAEKASIIKKQAEESVAEANKILDIAVAEVKKLKKDHIIEVKALRNPPPASLDILGAMCYLLQDELKKKGQVGIKMKAVEGAIAKKTEDYLSTAALLLADPQQLLDLLVNYDKENINQQYIYQMTQKILPSPNFNLEKASNCSLAIKFIFIWSRAMYDFNKVFLETEPLRLKLMQSEKIVKEKMDLLAEKKAMLAEVEANIQKLEEEFALMVAQKEKLEKDMEQCKVKLERALKLTSGLSDEKVRWSIDIQGMQAREELIPGNSVIGAGMLSYAGPFTSNYRALLSDNWMKKMTELLIKKEDSITMSRFLGVPVTIQQWNICGLPKDDTSIENGIIIEKSRRWSLMIDPQTQANKYIKNMGKEYHEEGIDVVKMSDTNIMRTLEIAIQHGKWVLVENVGKELDPSLDPILLQQVIKTSNGKSIQIGDKTLNYNENFRFFMTTTNPNPYYSPETFVKVCIINFAITKSGLEDQMLAQIVALENPQLEQKKTDIVKKNAQDKKDLVEIEDKILKSLSSTNDIEDLLKDETLINTLQNAKRFAAEINQRMKDSKITEIEIDKAREAYRSVAYRASILFFCIVDLNGIDPMYEYSLQWFINLFTLGVEVAPPAKEHDQRLKNLNDYFTYSLYENICRSLFERHKLLFSFMLTINIKQGNKEMVDEEWRYLLAGPTGDIEIPDNPTQWVSENQWPDMYRQIYGLSQLNSFNGFDVLFMDDSDAWIKMFDSANPQTDPYPAPWQSKLNNFQKIIILKAIRPDKVVPAVSNWICECMGEQFIIPPVFEIAKGFRDSSVSTPLIFVLSTGTDPKGDFIKFAEEMDMLRRSDSISLGQGQGPKAERIIKEYYGKGGWVLLQNCHLAVSWMPDLEKLVEEFNPEQMHQDFRLWLSSMPSAQFPISILQNGVKMTLEPPQGLRSNLKRTYVSINSDDFLKSCKKEEEFKKLVFGFSFFHAIIQDRRKFGPIGWNIPYEFTTNDLQVTLQQLKMLLDEYDQIPWKVLNFLGAEINYGGRVTDDKDRILIKSILLQYMSAPVLQDGHKFSPSGVYYSPLVGAQSDYINYIDTLPLDPAPEIFGLHDNASITNAQNLTRSLLATILSVQPRTSSGSGKTREEVIEDLANFIQQRTPKVFDPEDIFSRYPTEYNESMNTVLYQEVVRYNRLLSVMFTSLINVKKALKGTLVMSEDLENLSNSLYDNNVPLMWAEKGFLSLKLLASWVIDLNDRIKFIQEWIDNGTPNLYWLSGFFFPQAFITGTLQNYARKQFIAVDRLSFEYIIHDELKTEDVTSKPQFGCYIYGMFLEGARWDDQNNHQLTDSKPKELFSNLPLMHLNPVADREIPSSGIYKCPLYKVESRTGTLSTTGHSTNFVCFTELKTDRSENMWIIAGVAAFLSLRY